METISVLRLKTKLTIQQNEKGKYQVSDADSKKEEYHKD